MRFVLKKTKVKKENHKKTAVSLAAPAVVLKAFAQDFYLGITLSHRRCREAKVIKIKARGIHGKRC
jgi:hypothetical protein